MNNQLPDVNIEGFSIDKNLWESLRRCQKESIKKALLYTKAPIGSQGNKSCLISLPTGAGKSGVISVLAHSCDQKKILVLCHRRVVCNQLAKQIDGSFFEKASPGNLAKKKKVFIDVKNVSADGVYVTTFQMLAKLNDANLENIRNNFDLIIIDEGHSEPSPVWRTLVRGAKVHKIVVTATPYRNDLFQFDIDPDVSYIYTFSHALKDGVLKEPLFQTCSQVEVLQKVLDFLAINPAAKCIVKCKTFEEVKYFYDLFNSHVSVLAIHDRYANDARNNVKAVVPKDLAGSAYQVLIHQHKLDEGVDVPEAKLLVLTYVLGSGRELVQTVGRVVRLCGNMQPIVIEMDYPTNLSMWSSYRDFDLSLEAPEGARKFLSSLNSAKLIELYLNAFPEYSYHENRFVGKFDINSFVPDDTLRIPTASVCFFKTEPGFSVAQAIDTLFWRANNQGELSKVYKSSSNDIHILLSVAFNKSRFLSNELFFEPTLEVTLLRSMANSVVAIFDSRGRSFRLEKELKIDAPIDQEKLMKIMARDASLRPKEASTRSISSALKRPEAMHIKGRNLDDLGGQQQFASYRMSTIKCDTLNNLGEKSGSYYVGVDTGRISDHKDKNFNLFDLNEWLDMVDTCLSSSNEAVSRILRAFAKPVPISSGHVVESIILDFTEFDAPVKIKADGVEFNIDNDFVYLPYAGRALLCDGVPESNITINIKDEYPYIEFIADVQLEIVDPVGISKFDDFLLASIHKVFLKGGITYSSGKFYELRLPTQAGFAVSNSELSGVLIAREELLANGLTEKGHVNGKIETLGDEFCNSSVFHLVDKLKNYASPTSTISDLGPFYQHIGAPDYILCSDMGTEPADFLITSPEKIVYVHVKCGESSQRPQSSAGALAEVGSQAIKNLEMLVSNDRNLKAGNWTTLLNQ